MQLLNLDVLSLPYFVPIQGSMFWHLPDIYTQGKLYLLLRIRYGMCHHCHVQSTSQSPSDRHCLKDLGIHGQWHCELFALDNHKQWPSASVIPIAGQGLQTKLPLL